MSFSSLAIQALPVIAVATVAAFLVALVATPLVGRLIIRRAIIDHPDERRVHERPVPRGGGIAVALAFIVVGAPLALLGDDLPGLLRPRTIGGEELAALFGGGVLAVVLGAIDDRFDLRARWQFAGQLALALVAVLGGVMVTFISNPFGPGNLRVDTVIGLGFTVVWVVGMINSLNFIDGLDGLSTGIALIAAVALGLISLAVGVVQPYVAMLCFTLAGALLGFLRWNFHPATIFQGTAGVMFLGYVLAVLSILGFAKVVVAMLVLAVPIIDTFWVIVRRVSTGRSPFSPDRGHIHHRLLDVGLSHRATVLLIYAICATLGLLSLFVSTLIGVVTFLAALVAFGVMAFMLGRQGSGPREATR
ncbi:MAG: undecaprenyl/decaprenyl-phosphate alpha-N-acetylglucosaminyl 1-phosphate transferase [Chloroflexi bacterium]|nr:undecaprenyl/decaprenyl-phosphate alpha-N-acetylglucosaminyl 1-phosphate transferase [Chloroflexota bacterium]